MRAGLAAVLVAVAALFAAPQASAAYLYWANGDGQPSGSVGRANLDGSAADNNFVKTPNGICGVAADTENVYWTGGDPNGLLGKASLLTGAVTGDFVAIASKQPCGVAAGGGHVYFVNNNPPQIGRVSPDGSGLNPSLLNATNAPGIANPQLPTVHDSHLYWVNKEAKTIGRANLDGSNADAAFIPTGAGCNLLGVAVNDTHVYWAIDYPCMDIGRSDIEGNNIDNTLIEMSGDNGGVCGVAVHGPHIYWAHYGFSAPASVGRADLNGQNVDETFIPNLGKSCGVAVGPDPISTPISISGANPGFKFKPPVRCTKGCKRVLVTFEFDAAGTVAAKQALPRKKGKGKAGGKGKAKGRDKSRAKARSSARGKAKGKKAKGKRPKKLIKRLARKVEAGTVTLRLKTTGAGKAMAKKKGKLKVKATFAYTPEAGAASTITRVLKAKPPKPKPKRKGGKRKGAGKRR